MKLVRFLAALLPALLLSACAAPSAPERAAELEVHFFSAGAADAILLTTTGGAVLVDAGEKGFGKDILAYLEEKGVERLDYLIITHFDKDHVGGAAKVIKGVSVGTVLQSSYPKDSSEYEKYVKALEDTGLQAVTVRDELTFTLDEVRYTADPPRSLSYRADESNNSSLIITVQNGTHRFLLPGDAQTERLTEYLSGSPSACDVLKVAHHGREEPLLDAFLEAVSPAYAIITSSEEEPEDADVVSALERSGATVFLTREGPVTVRSDGVTLSVESGGA